MYIRRSPNLTKLGFDFERDSQEEYLAIQQMLVTKYLIQEGSMLTIMKEFNIPSSKTMFTLFKLFDVESRSLSEATTISIEQGRSEPLKHASQFKHIWHPTWFGTKVLLRSTLEEVLARALDERRVRYEVEGFRVKYLDEAEKRYRIAVPDFYLPSEHHIIEVKSDYWLDEANMRSKFKAYRNLGYKASLMLEGVLLEDWSIGRDSNSLCE